MSDKQIYLTIDELSEIQKKVVRGEPEKIETEFDDEIGYSQTRFLIFCIIAFIGFGFAYYETRWPYFLHAFIVANLAIAAKFLFAELQARANKRDSINQHKHDISKLFIDENHQ